jgi:hypothetical protein
MAGAEVEVAAWMNTCFSFAAFSSLECKAIQLMFLVARPRI